MSDDLVKRLRDTATSGGYDIYGLHCDLEREAADCIEQLEARILLLEGWLNGSLNVIEAFVAADTKEARKALEGKDV